MRGEMDVIGAALVVVLLSAAVAGGCDTGVTTTSDVGSAVPGGDAAQDMTIGEFRELLESYVAPVGDNARDAAASSGTTTVEGVYRMLSERGLGDVVVCADFDMDGTYVGRDVLDRGSVDAYPSYMCEYESVSGVLWNICCNDGSLVAVAYVADSGAARQIVLSETGSVTQYDGDRNEYSDFPLGDLTGVTAMRVPRIDRETLDSLGAATETL